MTATDSQVLRGPTTDSVLRAVTDDGAFRVLVTRSTDLVRGALAAQAPGGLDARNLADLLTATVLFRETMAPELRVQGLLRGANDSGSLIADSRGDGLTRALAQHKRPGEPVDLGEGALLQMMRTLPSGSVNRGVVRVPSADGITHAMMAYMQESEQVDTMLAVGASFDDAGQVVAAGGYLVQLLPEVGRGPLAVMTERLEDFRSIDGLLTADFSPVYLRDELLYGMPFTHLDERAIGYGCWCSEQRLIDALATLDRAELRAMVDDGAPLEIDCDYCHEHYVIATSKLEGLLSPS